MQPTGPAPCEIQEEPVWNHSTDPGASKHQKPYLRTCNQNIVGLSCLHPTRRVSEDVDAAFESISRGDVDQKI